MAHNKAQDFPVIYGRLAGGKKSKDKRGTTPWVKYVKKYAKKHDLTYGEALSEAGPSYHKKYGGVTAGANKGHAKDHKIARYKGLLKKAVEDDDKTKARAYRKKLKELKGKKKGGVYDPNEVYCSDPNEEEMPNPNIGGAKKKKKKKAGVYAGVPAGVYAGVMPPFIKSMDSPSAQDYKDFFLLSAAGVPAGVYAGKESHRERVLGALRGWERRHKKSKNPVKAQMEHERIMALGGILAAGLESEDERVRAAIKGWIKRYSYMHEPKKAQMEKKKL
jgi:hypothetical protein